jgi:hypothetical protein
VEVWEGNQRLGRAGEQAEGQAHHGGVNGDGGGRCVLGRAQGRDPGGFIGQERRKEASPERRGLQEPRHGHQGSWRRAAGLRPVVDGGVPVRVCAAAACRQPRGRRRVTPVGT